jgi:hypothetical protein
MYVYISSYIISLHTLLHLELLDRSSVVLYNRFLVRKSVVQKAGRREAE